MVTLVATAAPASSDVSAAQRAPAVSILRMGASGRFLIAVSGILAIWSAIALA